MAAVQLITHTDQDLKLRVIDTLHNVEMAHLEFVTNSITENIKFLISNVLFLFKSKNNALKVKAVS